MIRQLTATLMLVGLLSACGSKQSLPAHVATMAAPEPATTTSAPVAAAASAKAFNQALEMQGITFTAACPNDAARNTVTLTPAGLEADNSVWMQEVEGVVTGAAVGDLNADGSPEVYIYIQSTDPDAKGSVLGYAANNRKSLSLVSMPALSDSPDAARGYQKLIAGEAGWNLKIDRTIEF